MAFWLLFVLFAQACQAIALEDQFGSISQQNISNLMVCEWTIGASSPSQVVILTIEELETECGWDYIYIYDGPTNQSTLIGAFCGSRGQRKDDIVVSTSSFLFIQFVRSNSKLLSSGFNLTYSIGPPPFNCTLMDSNTQTCIMKKECQRTEPGKGECFEKIETLPPMAGHSIVYDPIRDVLYLFGGKNFDKSTSNFYLYDFENQTWTGIVGGETLTGRSQHASTFAFGKMYVFGGLTENGETNEFLVYDPDSGWTKINSINSPPPIFGHTLTFVEETGMIYLFGGYSDQYGISNRLYAYDINSNQWQNIRNTGLNPPSLNGHIAVYHAPTSRIYFHGGMSDNGISTNLVSFNIKNQKWDILQNRQSFLPVMHHSATLIDNYIVIMGGYAPNEDQEIIGSPCYLPFIYAFDIICGNWVQLQTIEENDQITSRIGHTLISRNQTVILTGGFNGVFFSGNLELSLTFPNVSSWDCLASYCSPFSCNECNTQPICSFCQEKALCFPNPQIAPQYINNYVDRCGEYQQTCVTPTGCPSFQSCGQCLDSGLNCIWCDHYQSCFSSDIRETVACPNDWDTKYCPREYCNDFRNCDECTSAVQASPSCSWCSSKCQPSDLDLISSPQTCSTPIARGQNGKCPVRCSLIKNQGDCHQSHHCFWCITENKCVEQEYFAMNYPFGDCPSWSLYDEIVTSTQYLKSLSELDHMTLLVNIPNPRYDVSIKISSKSLLSIQVRSLRGHSKIDGSSPELVISPNKFQGFPGDILLQITNPLPQKVEFEIVVDLRKPNSIDPTSPNFRIVYIIVFFFLFLFTFLVFGFVMKKLKLFLRTTPPQVSKPRFVLPTPKFSVSLVDSNQQLLILQPQRGALPISIEYEQLKNQFLVNVSFILVGPQEGSTVQMNNLSFVSTSFLALEKHPSHQKPMILEEDSHSLIDTQIEIELEEIAINQ